MSTGTPGKRKGASDAAKLKAAKGVLDFNALVDAICRAHLASAAAVSRAVNTHLTMRNWIIGAYIHHYELHGKDRAAYGDRLLPRLAERLDNQIMTRTHDRELRRYRAFYLSYPQIREALSPKSGLVPSWAIWETVSPKLPHGTISAPPISTTLQPGVSPQKLLESLSFSHFAELLAIDDPLERRFYEIECIRGNWSVRALRRQISSLYFARSGLSQDKDKLSAMTHAQAEQNQARLAIRDPYIFEFLGIKPSEVMAESDLEQAMLANLQEFLLELGHGFCLEARQKSIVIGQTRGFVDLVFYHRVLRCHILVELKVDEFRHEHIGQLNTYVAWFQKNMMQDGDNPPIGLLLCTGKDHALVEYALSSMSSRLFVSKYQLELPSKELLQRFLDEKLKEAQGDI
jgi:predicted nuclease of restriction endonuclease-like (RecB) superfamily